MTYKADFNLDLDEIVTDEGEIDFDEVDGMYAFNFLGSDHVCGAWEDG